MTIYNNYTLGLQLSHRALTRNLDRFIALGDTESVPPDLGEYLTLYLEFLEVHHAGEEQSLFPALRRHTAGRSTDAAHLDRWSTEHRDIARLHDEMQKLSGNVGNAETRRTLAARSRDLLDVFEPHFTSEEEVLTPKHLADMITAPELAAATEETARANRGRALAMAGFLTTSLEPDEQRALFGGTPWVFRRVLLPISRRRMRKFDAIVHPAGAA